MINSRPYNFGSLLTCGYTSLISFLYFSQSYPFFEYSNLLSFTSVVGLIGVALIAKHSISDNNQQATPINYYTIPSRPLFHSGEPREQV